MSSASTGGGLRLERRDFFGLRDAQPQGATDAPAFDLALFSGGDARVFLDPATGRTKYGTPHGCAEDEVWFSSSTASALSPLGYAAAFEAWQSLVAGTQTLAGCCDVVRDRLVRLFGDAGTQAVLAGSGTEAILVALCLVRSVTHAPLATIIVGAAETGRGVPVVADGRHFLQHAAFAEVTADARLDGLQDMDMRVETIALREAGSALRSSADIDAELVEKVARARREGRDVIIHRLDVSKTGQTAPGLEILETLCREGGEHIFVIADCCQLRTSAEHIKSLGKRGFLVAVTGSKFAGGPSFCGALLVPSALTARVKRRALPAGLAAYSAQLDWPASLRGQLSLGILPAANIGLALRWHAALAEIERFHDWPATLRDAVMRRFSEAVTMQAAQTTCLDLLPGAPMSADSFGQTILSIAARHRDGRAFTMAEAGAVQRRLRGLDGAAPPAKRFHLGQPVEIGGAGILRVCASAPLVNRLATAVSAGSSLDEAFAPVSQTLTELFRSWAAVTA